MNLSLADWIAIATVALPLIAKAFSDWSANATLKHNAALANITSMASRKAASIARELLSLPAGANPAAKEQILITDASRAILTELASSSAITGADPNKLAAVVQGELDKVLVAPKASIAPAATPPTT
jgi:hypothetical protein